MSPQMKRILAMRNANMAAHTAQVEAQRPDGTTGCGRVPFKTADEAQAHIDRNPRFPGMNAY